MLKSKKLVIAVAACAFAAIAALTACTGTSQPASNSNSNSSQPTEQSSNVSSESASTENAASEIGKEAVKTGMNAAEKVAGALDYSVNYFAVIAQTPADGSGTLDSAVKCLKFASESSIAEEDADIESIREEMLNAYEGMNDEARANFDARFLDIFKFIDEAVKDPDSVIASDNAQEEAVAEFKELLADKDVMAAWDKLKANTLTLGNSTGE